jgi:hypothetical protein
MTLTLAEARRIAGEVVAKEHPALEVLGATSAEGGSHYTEVILTARGGTTEPCRNGHRPGSRGFRIVISWPSEQTVARPFG